MAQQVKTIWILGDQLHEAHAGLAAANKTRDVVLMIESKQRAAHFKYHQIKLTLVYSAMRHRAEELRRDGWRVDYRELTDDFENALAKHIREHKPAAIAMETPNDFPMADRVQKLATQLAVKLELLENTQFLMSRSDFAKWAGESKHLLMETHYRKERKRLGVLMDKAGKPEGGAWNFDEENRQTFSAFQKELKAKRVKLLERPEEPLDVVTRAVIAMVKRSFPEHPGDAEKMWLPVTRSGARAWLKRFVEERLSQFGPWEDVMVAGERVIFHSVLSPMLNLGLLTPRECIEAAVSAYQAGRAPINSVEGFIRQIIGWREFVNGIYWTRGPGYLELNELGAKRELPSWIYTGDTEMNCLKESIRQALETGYNHHIQRLMVLGNFFLLGGFHPEAVYRWYMEMYVDAYEWVMAANVIGMILFADGGYMSTKPYAAGAGYIQKMSNYCAGCRFDPKVKLGPKACPFNYLYWNFYAEHEARFASNPRVSVMVKMWQSKSESEKTQIRNEAKVFLESVSAGQH